jgi:hypothetical protein
MSKNIKHICKNCKLYNMQDRHCSVIVLFEGERMYPPTEPEDSCLFEEEFICLDEKGEKLEKWTPEIQEVKFWVENPITGERGVKEGVVRIQYPENFFPRPTLD